MVWDLGLAEFTWAVVGEPVEKAPSSRGQSLEWDASGRHKQSAQAWLALGPPPTLERDHWVFSFEGAQRGRRKSRNKWRHGSQDRLKEQCQSRMWHGWSAWALLVTLGEFWEVEAGPECVTRHRVTRWSVGSS